MNTQLMAVPFHGDNVVLVGQDNEPYVAMKPIVTNLGLAWSPQRTKLSEKFAPVVTEIVTTGGDGKQYEMTCLPLRKLPAWLYSINPNKVAPELREKIVCYQEECDEVLWQYWTKGQANRTGARTASQEVTLSNHRLKLLKELQRTRNASMRSAIHQQLAKTSADLGLPVPGIDEIGWAEPEQPDSVKEFWDALDQLAQLDVSYNHAPAGKGLLCIHPPHLNELFKSHGIGYTLTLTTRQALRLSKSPRFIEDNSVGNSTLDGKKHRMLKLKLSE
ncbi:phage antirepressor N-terminal domain-containing protein [Pseudomonas sp. Marseille-Q5115]|uniref:phage antirepressor N-terminal domain-containing protein n=1 Tax=Pseudomonas sp. Marseille-Q5115 TaxID=2866593 RepID=UPI001CE3FB30|nr:phage antirepressor N-terminal domain-containing protein [Pseudomonas sp. Marseille-Q5115]